jgi:hypothetical protein
METRATRIHGQLFVATSDFPHYQPSIHGDFREFAKIIYDNAARDLGLPYAGQHFSMDSDHPTPTQLADGAAIARKLAQPDWPSREDLGHLNGGPEANLGHALADIVERAGTTQTGVMRPRLLRLAELLHEGRGDPLPVPRGDGTQALRLNYGDVGAAIFEERPIPQSSFRIFRYLIRQDPDIGFMIETDGQKNAAPKDRVVFISSRDPNQALGAKVDPRNIQPCVDCPMYRNNAQGEAVCAVLEECPETEDKVKDIGAMGQHVVAAYVRARTERRIPNGCLVNRIQQGQSGEVRRFLPERIVQLQAVSVLPTSD